MCNAAFFGDARTIDRVYGNGRKEQIAAATHLYADTVNAANFDQHAPHLRELDIIFSTWSMPALTEAQWDSLPRLKAVFYAAGSIQHFAAPLLARGIVVVSAWQVNATFVAEFTIAQIVLAAKGYFRNSESYTVGRGKNAVPGRAYSGETVAVLGAGAIGRKVIELLRHFSLRAIVFDPYLSDSDAAALGVEKVTLEQAFERGFIVTNHLANKPETVKLLNAKLFRRMRDGAAIINTGRGATIDEEALISELMARPSLSAFLDVTFPEPPLADSPLFQLPNVHLSSHIAGVLGGDVAAMADSCIEEFHAWRVGKALRHRVDPARFAQLA